MEYSQLGKKAIDRLADKNNLTVQEVENEISSAISAAMKSAKDLEDQRSQKFWEMMCRGAEKPSPAEVVAFLSLVVALEGAKLNDSL